MPRGAATDANVSPACSARATCVALEHVELRAQRGQRAQGRGRVRGSQRALEQREDSLCVRGHTLDNAMRRPRSGTELMRSFQPSEVSVVEDLCAMTAVPATLRLRREGVLRSRAARGDAAAFAAVYERHHQALYRYCRSILRHEEDAQDALQSTMTRAFAALQDEQRDFELRPWLFRIAHNEAISILRRRRTTAELDDVPGGDGEIEDRVCGARGAAGAGAGPRRSARAPARGARPARAQRPQPRGDRRGAGYLGGGGQAGDLRGAQRALQLPRGA